MVTEAMGSGGGMWLQDSKALCVWQRYKTAHAALSFPTYLSLLATTGALIQDRVKFSVEHLFFSSAPNTSVGAYTVIKDIKPKVCFSLSRIICSSTGICWDTGILLG